MFKPKKEKTTSDKSKKNFKLKKVEKGDKFYTYDGYLSHIIDIIKDDGTGTSIVVYRCWLKYKKRWGFYCEPLPLHLYTQCMINELPEDTYKEYFKKNNVDSKIWL